MEKITELKENIKKTEDFLDSLKKELWAAQEAELKSMGYSIGAFVEHEVWNDKVIKYQIVQFIRGCARMFPLKKDGKPSQVNGRTIALDEHTTKHYKLVK